MNIDGKTKLLGLIGTPVEHSKSPAMYNYCFEKYGLNCAYLAFDVDMDHVADAIAALRTFKVLGCNVTMPLKNAVIPYLDEVSPASRAIGSVNTIVNKDGKLCGTPAVIDKDFGSELLAELLDADVLVILTAVEQVAINFNKPDQKGLDDLTPAQAKVYMDENQFAKGSMLPKVQAAVKFAESKAGRTALITLLEKAKDGIEGKTGTRVHQ